MTGLLVSVRSAEETRVALEGGADVIDVKEPRNGALGAAEPRVWDEVLASIGEAAVMTSAALGELHSTGLEERAQRAIGFNYVKIGLSGIEQHEDTADKWFTICKRIPGCDVVPVVYADEASDAAEFLTSALAAAGLAGQVGSRLVVVDTFEKTAGNLLDHVGIATLRELSSIVRRANVRLILAGSLDEAAIEALLPLQPAFVGVRGAVCVGGRDGAIDFARVKSLARRIRRERQKAAS